MSARVVLAGLQAPPTVVAGTAFMVYVDFDAACRRPPQNALIFKTDCSTKVVEVDLLSILDPASPLPDPVPTCGDGQPANPGRMGNPLTLYEPGRYLLTAHGYGGTTLQVSVEVVAAGTAVSAWQPTAASPVPSASPTPRSALADALLGPSLPFRVLAPQDLPLIAGPWQVLRSEQEFWAEFARPDVSYGHVPTSPPIDFQRESVLMVSMVSGTNWSQHEIVRVEERPTELVVHSILWDPEPGPVRPAIEGYFAEAIALPRGDKPVNVLPPVMGYRGERAKLFGSEPPLPLPGPLAPGGQKLSYGFTNEGFFHKLA
jgi:hypothetical protein